MENSDPGSADKPRKYSEVDLVIRFIDYVVQHDRRKLS